MMQEYKDLVIQAKNDSKYMQNLLCIMEPLVKSYAKKLKKRKISKKSNFELRIKHERGVLSPLFLYFHVNIIFHL